MHQLSCKKSGEEVCAHTECAKPQNKQEASTVASNDGVMPHCFLCESLKLESRTPLMKATNGIFICHDCIDTLYEVITAEKKGEKLKLPKGV